MILKEIYCWLRASPLLISSRAALLLLIGAEASQGQIVLDGKFGTSGALSGPNYTIGAGMGLTRGNNLFQSFAQFNLAAGDTATFTGPVNIQNILCRVTGSGASSIDGTIRSDISGANFFFINPNGIIFGPNASVDVTGSFAASTANYLKLSDGARFVAALDADDSGLSTAPVSAFGFLGGNSGSITVQQSTLAVPNGQSLSIVGGDVAINGATVQAPQGQIDIASVHSAGEVPADLTTLSAAAFNAAFPQQGQISVQNNALLDSSGEGGGRIVIRGGQLTVDNSVIQANTTGSTDGEGIDVSVLGELDIVNGGQIKCLSTAGLGAGGDIDISAQSIELNGGGLVDNNFNPLTEISTATGDMVLGGGTGPGGNIDIQTGRLQLVNSAQISSASFGAGNAGSIDINATSILLDAKLITPTQIIANSEQIYGGGNAGDISINTDKLQMQNGATILAATFGSGQAGRVDINAQSIDLFSGSIITAGTFGSGNGGDIQITTESLTINGRAPSAGGMDFLTGIQAVTTSSDYTAPGGNIEINTGALEMQNKGSIFTTSYGNGQGGNINIQAAQVNLANDSSILASGEGTGPAGSISVSSDQDVILTGNSALGTSAMTSGGDITVTAGGNIELTDSMIDSQAGPGGGGNITLKAPSMIYLQNGTLTAQAIGDGGNLTISDPAFFLMNGGALISKSSAANGGNITILSSYFFKSGSTINASAPFGLPGTVSVSAPEVDLSGVLVGLAVNLLDAESQLRPDCAVRTSGDVSTLILLGRGGLPIEPGGFVPSGTVPPVDERK